ncbi:MAG TPA: amidase family protein, partial [Candidatus Krumholzibacteria bacterium]
MSDLGTLTIAGLRRRIAAGEVTPLDAADAALERIEARDGEVHAFLHVDHERVRERAKQLSAHEGNGALHGVPVAIKDNMCLRGTPTTCASKIL